MSTTQISGLQSVPAETNPSRTFLENIAYKKVANIALSCFECLVHWFVTTFSCCYPAYDRFYKEELARVSVVISVPAFKEQEVATIEPATTPRELPKVTKFRSRGELHDFTSGAIAGLGANIETNNGYYNGRTHPSKAQSVTLNEFPVLLFAISGITRDQAYLNYFDFPNEKDRLIVRNSTENPDTIVIQEYSEALGKVVNTWIADPTKLYERTYKDWHGKEQTEQVYITNQTDLNGLKLLNDQPTAENPLDDAEESIGPIGEINTELTSHNSPRSALQPAVSITEEPEVLAEAPAEATTPLTLVEPVTALPVPIITMFTPKTSYIIEEPEVLAEAPAEATTPLTLVEPVTALPVPIITMFTPKTSSIIEEPEVLAEAPAEAIFQARAIEQIIAQAPIEPKVTKLLLNGELHDFTVGSIAGLKQNTEITYFEKKAQFLTLKDKRVMLLGSMQNEKLKYFEFKDEYQKITIKHSSEDPAIIIIEIPEKDKNSAHAFGSNKYEVNLNQLHRYSYLAMLGNFKTEIVYVTDKTDMDWLLPVTLLSTTLSNQATVIAEVAREVLPSREVFTEAPIEAIPQVLAIEPAIVPAPIKKPKITNLLFTGTLHDFTTEKIAGLEINKAKQAASDGRKYQFLTLNGIKIFWIKQPSDISKNFLETFLNGDKIIVTQSEENQKKIIIKKHSEFNLKTKQLFTVDTTKFYQRKLTIHDDAIASSSNLDFRLTLNHRNYSDTQTRFLTEIVHIAEEVAQELGYFGPSIPGYFTRVTLDPDGQAIPYQDFNA